MGSTGADFEEALATLPSLDTRAFLEARYRVEDYEQAWTDVRSRAHLKVMLTVDPVAR